MRGHAKLRMTHAHTRSFDVQINARFSKFFRNMPTHACETKCKANSRNRMQFYEKSMHVHAFFKLWHLTGMKLYAQIFIPPYPRRLNLLLRDSLMLVESNWLTFKFEATETSILKELKLLHSHKSSILVQRHFHLSKSRDIHCFKVSVANKFLIIFFHRSDLTFIKIIKPNASNSLLTCRFF